MRMFFHRLRPHHVDAVRNLFAPRKPRHPLLKLAFGVFGLALLVLLVVVGAIVGSAMLLGAALLRLLGLRGQPVARSAAPRSPSIEGEYRVVDKSAVPAGR